MLKIIFLDNTFTYEWDGGDIQSKGSVNGSFTYDARNKIEFQAQDGSKWSTTYKFNKCGLSLSKGTGCWHESGDFYKSVVEEYQNIAPSSTPTVLEGAWRHSSPATYNSIIIFTGNTFAYTQFSRSVNGRIIIGVYDSYLWLEGGTGGFWWYGAFASKATLDEYLSITPSSAPTVFEGKWKLNNATFTFSGNSFTYTQSAATIDGKKVAAVNIKGRIIFDNNNITLITDDGLIKWTTSYTVSATKLDLKQGSGWYYWIGIFTKQK
jgi:hypothetical protein